MGNPDREPVVLVAQRLEPEKDTDVAVRAFALSGLAGRGWRLEVAGDVHDFEPAKWLDPKEIRRTDRFSHYAIAAGKLAWEDALDGFEAGVQRALKKYPDMRAGLVCIATRDYGPSPSACRGSSAWAAPAWRAATLGGRS